jgi:N6-L-threonylcarbamoyladenine synthase
MLFLGIETSCDETSIAILQGSVDSFKKCNFITALNSFKVLGSVISSQASLHAKYGGVIPEVSARNHAEQIHDLFSLVINQVVETTNFSSAEDIYKEIGYVFVTSTPGLMSALAVGIEFAKSVEFFIQKLYNPNCKLELVNHLHGHIFSSFYYPGAELETANPFPHLHLLVSGGNTQILTLNSPTDITILAQTLDDAAGECLDKIGRMIGLDYPAGGTIGQIANGIYDNPLQLPIGMKGNPTYNFSYSGLKTAVRYAIRDCNIPEVIYEKKLTSEEIEQLKNPESVLNTKLSYVKQLIISAYFVIHEQLKDRFKKAISSLQPKSIGLSGGVSASPRLRAIVESLHPISFIAPKELTGDNAIMIVLAGLATIDNS